MPNIAENILKIKGTKQQIEEVVNYLNPNDNKSEVIDFNNIKKMPSDLDITASSLGDVFYEYLYNNEKIDDLKLLKKTFVNGNVNDIKKGLELAIAYNNNIKNYGYKEWYDWCEENWGSKWNAFDSSFDGNDTFFFETASNGVNELIELLSKRFEDVEFEYKWHESGMGCGFDGVYCQGQVIQSSYLDHLEDYWCED